MRVRFWQSIVGYFVATMAVAYPWHMVLFHDKYVAMGAFTRGEPIMAFGMTAIALQAIVFAKLFPMYLAQVGSGNRIVQGIRFSVFLGMTVYSVMVFATAAKFAIEPASQFVLYGSVFQLIQFVLVGAVLGFIHRHA